MMCLCVLTASCNSSALHEQELVLVRVLTDEATLPDITELSPVFALQTTSRKSVLLAFPQGTDLQKVAELLPDSFQVVEQEQATVLKLK